MVRLANRFESDDFRRAARVMRETGVVEYRTVRALSRWADRRAAEAGAEADAQAAAQEVRDLLHTPPEKLSRAPGYERRAPP